MRVGLLRRHTTGALATLAVVVLVVAGAVYWGSRPTAPAVPAEGETPAAAVSALDLELDDRPTIAVLPLTNLSGLEEYS